MESQRWIQIGPINFQPSEVARSALSCIFPPGSVSATRKNPRRINPRSYWSGPLTALQRTGFLELVPYGAILLSIAVLMMLEPHVGYHPSSCWAAQQCSFAAGIKLYWFVGGAAGLAGLLLLMMSGYQSTRIKIWRDPGTTA